MGYTDARSKQIKIYSVLEMIRILEQGGFSSRHLGTGDSPSLLGKTLYDYFDYLTGIVNMLIETYTQGFPCEYDPQKVTILTHFVH